MTTLLEDDQIIVLGEIADQTIIAGFLDQGLDPFVVVLLGQPSFASGGDDGASITYVDDQDASVSADAHAYADSGDTTERNARIAADAAEVTARGTAVTNAITTAANDATTKANTARSGADTHSDAGDTATLSSAHTYADSGDAATLAAAVLASFKTLAPQAIKVFSDSPVTVLAGQFVPFNTTGGSMVANLPSAPADRSVVGLKMPIQGGTNTVTYNCTGSDVFNKAGGATTGTLSLANQAVFLMYSSAVGIWYIISDDLTLSSLDSRYASIASVAGVMKEYATQAGIDDIGNGTAFSYTWNHAQNITKWQTAIVFVIDLATSWPIEVDAKPVDANHVQIDFPDAATYPDAVAPASGAYRAVILYSL